MEFLLLNYVPQATPDDPATAENHADTAAWEAYTTALLEAGVMRGGQALRPGFAGTTVRVRNGRSDVHDGPYADSKEELGGFYLIDVPDLDTAIAWAARNPAAAAGAVEVRPVLAT